LAQELLTVADCGFVVTSAACRKVYRGAREGPQPVAIAMTEINTMWLARGLKTAEAGLHGCARL